MSVIGEGTYPRQASTLTSVIPPKRTKITNDGQFSKSIRQKTDEDHQAAV